MRCNILLITADDMAGSTPGCRHMRSVDDPLTAMFQAHLGRPATALRG